MGRATEVSAPSLWCCSVNCEGGRLRAFKAAEMFPRLVPASCPFKGTPWSCVRRTENEVAGKQFLCSNCPVGWGLGTVIPYQGRVRLESWQPSEQTKSERMKSDFLKKLFSLRQGFSFLNIFEIWMLNTCQIDLEVCVLLTFYLTPSDH